MPAPLIDINDPRQLTEIVAALAFTAGFEWGSNAGMNTGDLTQADWRRKAVMPPEPTTRYHGEFPELAAAHEDAWNVSFNAGFRLGLENCWGEEVLPFDDAGEGDDGPEGGEAGVDANDGLTAPIPLHGDSTQPRCQHIGVRNNKPCTRPPHQDENHKY